MISALVCDEHRLFGESFAGALRGAGAVVSVTSHPDDALGALARVPVDRLVLNVLLPRGSGIAAIRYTRDTWPGTHISCFGADHPAILCSAVEAGAHAVLSKKRPLAELVDTVLRASPVNPWPDTQPVPTPVGRQASATEAKSRSLAKFLTNREREVLRLLVGAQPTYRIADELGISVTTTRGYVQSILTKLGVHSRVEAVSYAVRHSVVF